MRLLAESGSTKTDWVVLDTGERFQSLGINPFFNSEEQIVDLIRSALSAEILASVHSLYFYGTGAVGQGVATLQMALSTSFPLANIDIKTDLEAAAFGSVGLGTGLVGILGTGSNSGYFEQGKLMHQIPPLGFWLGDEGSGGFLGKQLILSYLHKDLPQELRVDFEKSFGAFDRFYVFNHAYNEPRPNRFFAQFAPFVSKNIEHVFVQNLVEDSFAQYFKKYILKYPDVASKDLYLVGSVAKIFEELCQKIAVEHGLHVRKVMKSPMEGLINYHKL